MSRDGVPPEPSLPGHDLPSAEVLDELLRAFSVDTEDTGAHRAVDLHSPEVDELLAPPSPPEVVAEPVAAAGGDEAAAVPPDDDDGIGDHDGPAGGSEAADPGDGEAADDGPGDAPPGDDEAGDDEAGDDEPAPADTADQLPTAPRVIVIGGPRDASPVSSGVAGDPFLGGSPAPPPSDERGSGGPTTITIVDDGIPDSVYIGGNLSASDTSRSTVVIEDHPGDPASVTMSVEEASAATKIEPRMRERRLAVRRAAGRKRVRWAIAASVLILLVVASLAVVGSGLFAVETVRVAGNEHSDQAALDAIVADLEGTPVLLVDEHAVERQVETLPWVDEARVTTRFPDRATIEVRERVPAAAFQGPDQQWRLIDQEARVLAISEAAPAGIIPVTGDDFPDAEPGQYLAQGLSDAATLARSLTPLMLARVQSISVALDRSDLRMLFTDGTEVRFGRSDDGLVQKLVRLETTLNDLGEDRVSYIDVSTNEVGTG